MRHASSAWSSFPRVESRAMVAAHALPVRTAPLDLLQVMPQMDDVIRRHKLQIVACVALVPNMPQCFRSDALHHVGQVPIVGSPQHHQLPPRPRSVVVQIHPVILL